MITRYLGDRITINGSVDDKPLDILDGAILADLDTKNQFIKIDGAWVQNGTGVFSVTGNGIVNYIPKFNTISTFNQDITHLFDRLVFTVYASSFDHSSSFSYPALAIRLDLGLNRFLIDHYKQNFQPLKIAQEQPTEKAG